MTHAENGDRLVLMSELPGQGVDLGLALGGHVVFHLILRIQLQRFQYVAGALNLRTSS